MKAMAKEWRFVICLANWQKNKNLLGKKSNQGFYKYSKDGKNLGVNSEISQVIRKVRSADHSHTSHINNHDIIDRCILVMVNEAAKCLEENVVKNHRYLDMAMIMGTGFPAFRGGLLRYADEIGIGVVVARLKEFSKTYGTRFEPASLLIKMDHDNQKFYN